MGALNKPLYIVSAVGITSGMVTIIQKNYCTFECSVEIGNRLFEQTFSGYRSKKKVRQKFDEFVAYFKDHPYPGERSPQRVFEFMY